MNNRYDWDWVRSYYVRSQRNSRTSFKELSKLFKIPYQTIRRKAAQEGWVGHTVWFRTQIKYFENMDFQREFLSLAIPLAHKDYSKLGEMEQLDVWE